MMKTLRRCTEMQMQSEKNLKLSYRCNTHLHRIRFWKRRAVTRGCEAAYEFLALLLLLQIREERIAKHAA